MLLWNNKTMHIFQYPVDAALVPTYYTKIKNPICLLDIRDNLGQCIHNYQWRDILIISSIFIVYTAAYKYKTTAAFLDDVALISRNSELFNGHDHEISKLARKLFTDVKRLIEVEQAFVTQENDIKIK